MCALSKSRKCELCQSHSTHLHLARSLPTGQTKYFNKINKKNCPFKKVLLLSRYSYTPDDIVISNMVKITLSKEWQTLYSLHKRLKRKGCSGRHKIYFKTNSKRGATNCEKMNSRQVSVALSQRHTWRFYTPIAAIGENRQVCPVQRLRFLPIAPIDV